MLPVLQQLPVWGSHAYGPKHFSPGAQSLQVPSQYGAVPLTEHAAADRTPFTNTTGAEAPRWIGLAGAGNFMVQPLFFTEATPWCSSLLVNITELQRLSIENQRHGCVAHDGWGCRRRSAVATVNGGATRRVLIMVSGVPAVGVRDDRERLAARDFAFERLAFTALRSGDPGSTPHGSMESRIYALF